MMRASPLMRFLGNADPLGEGEGEPAAPPNPPAQPIESPSPQAAPSEPLATPARKQRGQRPVYPREPLWQLAEQNPNSSAKQLAAAYEDKTKIKVSPGWVRKVLKLRPQ
jgi:hypothetical protein